MALAADQNAFNAAFNLADAIYKQENYGAAATLFQGLTEKAKSSYDKAMAYHNLGNSYLKEQKLNESIEAYKSALRNNPTDTESKYNLAYAQRMKQQQEENQEEEQEENQEEEQQEENKEEQQQEEEQEQQESQQDSKQEEQPQKEQKPQETQNPDKISKEEAEKMLDALQQQEKELQEDLQKKKAKGVKLKIEKDW